MSISYIGLDQTPGSGGRERTADDEKPGMFDLLVAAIASQSLQLKTQSDTGFQLLSKQTEKNAVAPSVPAAPPPDVTPAAEVEAPQPTAPTAPKPKLAAHHAVSPAQAAPEQSAHMVNLGTLPVIVAGQLVELTLLRDRRPSRDPGSSQRLTMVLEAPSSGSVKVSARVEGASLVLDFNGAAGDDVSIRNEYTREVEALTRRLGWKFTETRWESVL